jgi:hypothetical protein
MHCAASTCHHTRRREPITGSPRQREAGSRARRVAAAVLLTPVLWLIQPAASDATPAYPPPSACALSAEQQNDTARWTISGTGFAARRAIAVMSSGAIIARPVSDADGSFQLMLTLPAGSGRHQISAAGSGCATSLTATDRPLNPSESPAPTGGLVSPSLLPRETLRSGFLLGLIAAVICLGIGLLVLASSGGHRKPS